MYCTAYRHIDRLNTYFLLLNLLLNLCFRYLRYLLFLLCLVLGSFFWFSDFGLLFLTVQFRLWPLDTNIDSLRYRLILFLWTIVKDCAECCTIEVVCSNTGRAVLLVELEGNVHAIVVWMLDMIYCADSSSYKVDKMLFRRYFAISECSYRCRI